MIRVYYVSSDDRENGSDTAMKLLRLGLAEDFGISLSLQDIHRADGGKPYLKDYPQVHFNISHTKTAVAVAVGDCPVGIDVQTPSDRVPNRVAKRLFSENERAYVGESAERFFEIWVMKESYVKLTGEGITKRISQIDVMGECGAVFTKIEIKDAVAYVCTYGVTDVETVKADIERLG